MASQKNYNAMELQLRQSQKNIMTPKLQQAIALLNYSAQDLSAYIADAMQNNPMLEYSKISENSPQDKEAESNTADSTDKIIHEQQSDGFSHVSNNQYQGRSRYDSDYDIFDNLRSRPNLRTYLLQQINLAIGDSKELLIAYKLVDCLDGNGWLSDDYKDLPKMLRVSDNKIESVIRKIQKLEPAGIFARNLRECLLLQVQELGLLTKSMQIMLDNLDNLVNLSDVKFSKQTGLSMEETSRLIKIIRSLNPKPVSDFSFSFTQEITPDLLLLQDSSGHWRLELNQNSYPHICINQRYHPSYPQKNFNFTSDDRRYISENYSNAKWLVRSIRRRSETILKVASEIVEQQKAFFEYGLSHMRPLILRDVANATDLHESTISRVINGKYIISARGVFELKYFFTASLQSCQGGTVISAASVRHRIDAMISGEKADAILSDSDIADMLMEEGIDIARRTVAKYREAMRIASSVSRRKEKNSSLAHV